MKWARPVFAWTALTSAVAVPVLAAAFSPLLAWRGLIYIVAGFAGIFGLGFLLFQPLLAGGYLPNLPPPLSRRIHRALGRVLVAAVIVHVAGLWITSPPDVVDALMFVSPTPFSVWGVIAMWALFISAFLVPMRRRLGLHPRLWRLTHTGLAVVVVAGTIAHAALIDGAMESVTKIALCVLISLATFWAVMGAWVSQKRRRV